MVRSFDRDVRVVFTSGRSLKDMLVSSSFSKPQCPRTVQQQREKSPGGGVGRLNVVHAMVV